MASRPLSPHLSIYRFAYTMTLSILHRATGVLLSLGLVLLVAWLFALASGPDAYANFTRCAGSWPVQVLVALLLVSFCYHLANGVRHLVWDMGKGLERHQARASGRAVVIFTVLASAVVLYLAFIGGRP
jgi:succinate dehydrogenase / fumarate reductase cytochrome b subunit